MRSLFPRLVAQRTYARIIRLFILVYARRMDDVSYFPGTERRVAWQTANFPETKQHNSRIAGHIVGTR